VDNQTPSPTGAPPPAPSFPPPKFPAPSGAFPPPGDVKFPARPAGPKPLVLPRRVNPLQRAQEATQATAAARKSIDAIRSMSRAPWSSAGAGLSNSHVEELEKALRALEAKVGEREMALAEAERKLAERDRALAETEALLQAREKIIDAMRKQPAAEVGGGINPEELEALRKLKEELDRQEASMKEQREAIREREEFLEQSEASLFEKMQSQQEKETELEQKAEDLKRALKNAGLAKEEPKEPMEKA
jgi:DNA repair exonuclease SbcCD ATPase subunit